MKTEQQNRITREEMIGFISERNQDILTAWDKIYPNGIPSKRLDTIYTILKNWPQEGYRELSKWN